MVPVLAWRFYLVDVRPGLAAKLRALQRAARVRSRQSTDPLRAPSARRARRSLRSGYAFAHQEGFGRLITSGKIMRRLPNADFSFPSLGGKFTSTAARERERDKEKTAESSTAASVAAPDPPLRAPCQDLDTINL